MKRFCLNQKAHVLTEYAILLGVAAFAFVGMMLYTQRNIQLRIKNITDSFISDKQLTNTDDTTEDNATSTYSADTAGEIKAKTGAGMEVDMHSRSVVDTRSTTKETEPTSIISLFLSWRNSDMVDPERRSDTDTDFISDLRGLGWENKDDISSLESDKEKLVARIDLLEQQASEIENSSNNLSVHMGNLGSFNFLSGISDIISSFQGTGNDLSSLARRMREDAATLRDWVAQIDGRIAFLRENPV